jgi:hypothetical protein
MKRLLLGMVILGGAALLGGCPIFPDGQESPPLAASCPSNCGYGYTCDPYGECVPVGSSTYDASVESECGYCPPGTTCGLADGVVQCLAYAVGTPPSDSGPAAVDAGDAATVDGGDGGPVGKPCNADAQCGGGGARCIDGLCATQSQLCSDGTQCLVAGDACVDGVCLPRCTGSTGACGAAGYQCDFGRGVCSVNPVVCSATSDCQGGAVCVESRCVAPCAAPDAGEPQCGGGQVCVNGGCIFDQQARFTCQNDGNSGTLANNCDPTSICLHGDCYPACGEDGGGCAGAGVACKSVTIAKGTFAVCGTATNLGSACDPAVGNYCEGTDVCIDGYCK